MSPDDEIELRLDRHRQEHIADVLERHSLRAADGYRRRIDKRVALNAFHRSMQGY